MEPGTEDEVDSHHRYWSKTSRRQWALELESDPQLPWESRQQGKRCLDRALTGRTLDRLGAAWRASGLLDAIHRGRANAVDSSDGDHRHVNASAPEHAHGDDSHDRQIGSDHRAHGNEEPLPLEGAVERSPKSQSQIACAHYSSQDCTTQMDLRQCVQHNRSTNSKTWAVKPFVSSFPTPLPPSNPPVAIDGIGCQHLGPIVDVIQQSIAPLDCQDLG